MSAPAEQLPAIEQRVEAEAHGTTSASEHETLARKEKLAFIQSLDPEAILALVSEHNDKKPCRMFTDPAHGSFNVCFFVEFPRDNTRCVVRVPILPRIQYPWEKVEGEAATINYIQKNTTIPVSLIHTYGKYNIMTKDPTTEQLFMICEYVEGKPLTSDAILSSGKDTQRKLFEQMFDIFLQLRELKFDAIGSIMPDKEGNPILEDPLPFSVNVVPGGHVKKCSTAAEYMDGQYNLLVDRATLPAPRATKSELEFERFAIHSMKSYYRSAVPEEFNNGPFVLRHHDLHLGNIIVNDKLEIQAVLDWEFTHTVPLPLFVPPLWATERGVGDLFKAQLHDAANRDKRYSVLWQDWFAQETDAIDIAIIIRYPDNVSDVFKTVFAKRLYGDDLAKAQADFKNST